MRIVYIAAGAGSMYCGSCLHDNALASALAAGGDDALLVPLYTPLKTDEPSVSQRKIFFGGVNVFLQQRFAWARRTPWLLDGLLDSPRLLRWLGSRSTTVRPDDLGELTVSMLRGEHGHQRKELEKLVEWLRRDVRPRIVHLSTALLAGLSGELSRRLNVPVVCTASGEDIFLDKLPEPHRELAWNELRRAAGGVSRFVALNRYFADEFASRVALPTSRVAVVPHGLRLDGFDAPRAERNGGPLRIGFFARVCHDKGLHQLIEAARLLQRDGGLPPFEIVAGGYLAEPDRAYAMRVERLAREAGLAYRYVGELDRPGKLALLKSFDVLSLPTVYRESKGISVLEAWAAGVPAVLPAHGSFPEMAADTGGALLYEPGSAEQHAAALGRLLGDARLRAALGRRAARAIADRYQAPVMAARTRELYAELLADA